jgi:hypothetical protein
MSKLSALIKDRCKTEAPVDEARRDAWVQAMLRLQRQIRVWLEAHDPDQVLQFPVTNLPLKEPGLGRYLAPRMKAVAGEHSLLMVEPKYRLVKEGDPLTGHLGRVDLVHGSRSVPLFLANDQDGCWVLWDEASKSSRPLDQGNFEAAVLQLQEPEKPAKKGK